MNPCPRFQCRLCKKYCKASDKVVECEDCEKCFHDHAPNLEMMNSQNWNQAMDLGFVQTAKLTVVYAVDLY